MKAKDILAELEPMGKESYKKVMRNHGVREPFYGVKIEDMKKIVKRLGPRYELALELYDTGVYDAMYLAGLVADDEKMTRKDLQHWVEGAYCAGLCEYTVPWVASGSPHGWKLALEWIESQVENTATAGWSTLSSIASTRPDDELDLPKYKELLDRVARSIHTAPNRVRYVMNGLVIAAGSYLAPLTDHAMKHAKSIGPVQVDMNGTSCKVPLALQYIEKAQARGSLTRKRKSAKC